jgi:PAS domain S-box-containing protein
MSDSAAHPLAAQYAAIVAAALDCIVTMNHEGRIVEFNPAAERTFGHARADVLGRAMADVIIPPGLRERHRVGLAHHLATGEAAVIGRRIEITALHADGHEFPVELTIIRLPGDGPPVFTGFIRDITDRREAERRVAFLANAGVILASSLDYETTFGNLVRVSVPEIADWCAAHILEEDGRIRCVALIHRDPAITEAVWPHVRDYHFDPDAADGGPKVIRTGQPILFPDVPDDLLARMATNPEDLRIRRLLGLKSVVAVPITSGGRVLGALAFVMSQSGRRYEARDLPFVEELARRAALAIDSAVLYRDAETANRMKDEFLATLSHELRTPLNAILGWARLLTSCPFDAAQRAHALRVIERNAKSQDALISDLLDMSRIIRGRLTLERRPVIAPLILQAAVDTVRPSAEAKEIQIDMTVGPAVRTASLVADPERLQQVFWNVLANAVKFTPRGGRVTVAASVDDDDLIVAISDNGEGIDPLVLPQIFERFRQADSSSRRSHGGLGLGLAIVRQLVELHGGTVTAQSAGRGQGTTFAVRLPLSRERAVHSVRAHQGAGVRDQRLRGLDILAVDDDADAREIVRATLEGAGAMVRTATSAGEALAAMTRVPDVLVADIGLPDEDGNDLIERIRRLSDVRVAKIPAIALSAYAGPRYEEQARNAGFDVYLVKPFEPSKLIDTIARLVETRA